MSTPASISNYACAQKVKKILGEINRGLRSRVICRETKIKLQLSEFLKFENYSIPLKL